MQGFAGRWRDEHRGQWFTAGKISGFCMLMKRAVYETVGGLDERFGLGLFDDDDLAVRGAGPGSSWPSPMICSSTISAAGRSRGMASMPGLLLQENGRKFAEKWGTEVGNGQAVPMTPWVAEPRMEERRNWPQINTDEHRWESGKQELPAGQCEDEPGRSIRMPV